MVSDRLIFAMMADLDELEKEVLLLTRSIRAFAASAIIRFGSWYLSNTAVFPMTSQTI